MGPDLFGSYGLKDALPSDLAALAPIAVLEKALETGRLPHAMLFSGDHLEGLYEIALALAACLLETERAESHPDFFVAKPAKRMRQISVDAIRELIHNVQHSSNQGGKKVIIISEVDRMNKAAANAFLKTLEEPPADTFLLLLTIKPYDLLDTIRSRCFNFRFSIPAPEIVNEIWVQWRADFKALLLSASEVLKTRDVTSPVMGVYGLVTRFNEVLDDLVDAGWKNESDKLGDHVDDETYQAHEVGFKKGIRSRLFADIEETLRDFSLAYAHENEAFDLASLHLAQSVASLEKMMGLMEVNLKEDVALEAFLLECIRVWAH